MDNRASRDWLAAGATPVSTVAEFCRAANLHWERRQGLGVWGNITVFYGRDLGGFTKYTAECSPCPK